MKNNSFKQYANQYKGALLDDVVPFWLKHSLDYENGGYFTCLAQSGEVFDRDKFIWLQGREAWMFSTLYNEVEKKPEWLEMAKSGIDFLIKHGRDENGDFYFSTTAAGEPLVKPYNIFSDCFAAMAFGQYGIAAGNNEMSDLAKTTYRRILSRQENPKGQYKKNTNNRPLKSFALPMILSNLVMELEGALDQEEVGATIDRSAHEVMEVFLNQSTGLIHEFVRPDGSFEDSFNGRLINPGHGIEAMWFMMDIGVRKNDTKLIQQATEVVLNILDHSWDEKYGGIFYFMDSKNCPPQQLEWDQKLWWVHLETLVALSKGYALTGNEILLSWFEKVHDYTWSHFPDPEHGEWFGYLNRAGEPLLDLKGGKWKGCFHVPRALFQCWKTFERIDSK